MGTLASQPIRQALASFLMMNQDMFAWSHDDMLGIDPLVIVHRLNVNLATSPIRQKKRVFTPERDKAIFEEVRKLLEAGFIREVYYPDWLANVVIVKKANWKVANMHRLHGPQPSMLKRQRFPPSDRHYGRFNNKTRAPKLHGHLLGI